MHVVPAGLPGSAKENTGRRWDLQIQAQWGLLCFVYSPTHRCQRRGRATLLLSSSPRLVPSSWEHSHHPLPKNPHPNHPRLHKPISGFLRAFPADLREEIRQMHEGDDFTGTTAGLPPHPALGLQAASPITKATSSICPPFSTSRASQAWGGLDPTRWGHPYCVC